MTFNIDSETIAIAEHLRADNGNWNVAILPPVGLDGRRFLVVVGGLVTCVIFESDRITATPWIGDATVAGVAERARLWVDRSDFEVDLLTAVDTIERMLENPDNRALCGRDIGGWLSHVQDDIPLRGEYDDVSFFWVTVARLTEQYLGNYPTDL